MKSISLKAKTREQVAIEYGISSRTLRRWFKQNNILLSKRLLCPKDLEMIYEKFGYPIYSEN